MYSLILIYCLTGKFNTDINFIQEHSIRSERECQMMGNKIESMLKKQHSEIQIEFSCF
jgi:hypothetical protein